jgi:signal transduction histidine kinase/CheY-like chemotaxis protein
MSPRYRLPFQGKQGLWARITGLGLLILLILVGFERWISDTDDHIHQARLLSAELLLMDSLYRESILRARFGIDPNYDAMARQQKAIDERVERLLALPLGQAMSEAIGLYAYAIRSEARASETFKSLNATVRNAVRYYQYESRQLIHALPNTPEGEILRRELHHFALNALYLISGTQPGTHPDSLRPLEDALAKGAALWPHEEARLKRLARHVEVLGRHIPLLAETMEQLTRTSPRMHLRSIQQQADQQIRRQALNASRFQIALLVLSLFLLLTLGLGLRSYLAAMAARIRLTAELDQHKNHLEALVKQRTQELAHAIEAAQAANVAKSRFLATMSHEIRTPMNGILGMAQVLMMDNIPDEKRKQFVRVILGSGQTLLTLLNDILDLSKVEAGKLQLEIRPFHPHALLEETLALFAQQAHDKNLRIKGQFHGPALACYRGDPHRIRQMLSNLLSNALKFTKEGEIEVTVHVRPLAHGRADAHDKVKLEWSVRDTGIGIPKDKQALLFSPFSQADSSTTRKFGGTGLGLSIVRHLAQLMDGETGIESEPGQGARFWFTTVLPEEKHVAPLPLSEPSKIHPLLEAIPPPPEKTNTCVLLVEDNSVNQMVVKAMLGKLDWAVETAENGREALDRLYGGLEPDFILMDVQMPEMDGYAATRAIRAWEAQTGRARLNIIALTADAFPEDRQRCIEAGMDDFLAKPISITALESVCMRFLRTPSQNHPAAGNTHSVSHHA